VGHYIIAATVEGEEGPADAKDAPPASASPPNYQELWANPGEIPPPIDPKQLRPARQNAPVHSDFLDWAADVPNPFQARAPSYPAPPPPVPPPPAAPSPPPAAVRPAAAINPDMDWAVGPPSHLPVPTPPSPAVPAPRRPGQDTGANSSWEDVSPVAADRPLAVASIPSSPIAPGSALPPSPAGTAPPDAFVRQLARAAGLPEEILTQKDPGEVAQQVGAVLRLVVENLMQLLNARLQAKRMARSASHTMVQAIDNNPLKFSPSAPDALRIMFGPATQSYLDAHRAIGQSFEDLKSHQIKTYSAMQHALTRLMADFNPQAIEQDIDEGRGIGGLLTSRKAKLWEAYESRWEAKFGREGREPIEAFMLYFAEYYDRDGG
jgi:type VI secretion system protein ImpI